MMVFTGTNVEFNTCSRKDERGRRRDTPDPTLSQLAGRALVTIGSSHCQPGLNPQLGERPDEILTSFYFRIRWVESSGLTAFSCCIGREKPAKAAGEAEEGK